jgi:hypothetical protein
MTIITRVLSFISDFFYCDNLDVVIVFFFLISCYKLY